MRVNKGKPVFLIRKAGYELCESQSGRYDIFVIGRGRRAARGAEPR